MYSKGRFNGRLDWRLGVLKTLKFSAEIVKAKALKSPPIFLNGQVSNKKFVLTEFTCVIIITQVN